jgi:exodeoxyribonuclease VII large subunit
MVRGGGGKPDLHCFDSYEMGRTIAMLPVPLISGIGHERDSTVVDEVSHVRVKTPTAAADLIITRIKEFEDLLDDLSHNLLYATNQRMAVLKENFSSLIKNVESLVRNELMSSNHVLQVFSKGLMYSLKFIRSEKERVRARESNIKYLDPRNVLKRGYSISLINNKAIKSSSMARAGDSLKTVLYKGEIKSRVE